MELTLYLSTFLRSSSGISRYPRNTLLYFPFMYTKPRVLLVPSYLKFLLFHRFFLESPLVLLLTTSFVFLYLIFGISCSFLFCWSYLTTSAPICQHIFKYFLLFSISLTFFDKYSHFSTRFSFQIPLFSCQRKRTSIAARSLLLAYDSLQFS